MPKVKRTWKRWSIADGWLVADLYSRKYPWSEVGLALGRTDDACRYWWHHIGQYRHAADLSQPSFTGRSLAIALGVPSYRTVYNWMRAGLLPYKKVGRVHSVDRNDLLDWLSNPRSWAQWDINKVVDPQLKSLLQEVDKSTYITTGEVATLTHFSRPVVNRWVVLGLLPAVKCTHHPRGGTMYLVPRVALEGPGPWNSQE